MLFKILHIADIHMGTENYGRLDPDTGLHTRLQDFIACLSFAVDTALDEQVGLVIFTGDAYRTCDPNPTHQRALASQFKRFSDAGIPVVMIVGNHDNPVSFGKASSLDIFNTLGPGDVRVISKPECILVETRGGPVQLACLPWPMKHNLLTRDAYKDLSDVDVRIRIEEICGDIIRSFADEADPLNPCILAAHVAATDARLSGTERAAVIGHEPTILTSILANPAFDYVALGHVHRHQDLNPSGNPHVVYPGSIERVDFGEEQEKRGFCIVEIEKKGSASFRFVESPARPFVTVDVVADGSGDPTSAIVKRIQSEKIEDAIVRVIYSVEEDRQHLVDLKAIRSALEPAFLVASIVRRTTAPERLRRNSVSEDLDLMDALDRYFENNPDLAPFADRMKSCAHQIEIELTEEQNLDRANL